MTDCKSLPSFGSKSLWGPCHVNIHFFGQTEEYSYRSVVRELVPQLQYLDDVPVEEEEVAADSRAPADEDLALLKESIKEKASSSNLQYLGSEREQRAPSSLSVYDFMPRIITPEYESKPYKAVGISKLSEEIKHIVYAYKTAEAVSTCISFMTRKSDCYSVTLYHMVCSLKNLSLFHPQRTGLPVLAPSLDPVLPSDPVRLAAPPVGQAAPELSPPQAMVPGLAQENRTRPVQNLTQAS